MTGTGIRQLAIGSGLALALAGCAAGTGPGAPAGDPAAAALAAEAISTTSLDGTPLPAAGSEAAGKVETASAPAATDPAAVDGAATDIAADTAAEAGEAPAPKERKGLFAFLKGKPKSSEADPEAGTVETAAADAAPAAPATARNSVRLVDRDVEAPDVISVTDNGLWDGRPSLGGVWVAYADVRDPERVIIRNTANGSFVIGALFRRERENPGPRLQVSSDAAAALGMLAGAPAKLNVTALRREEVVDPADAEALLGDESPITAQPIAGEAVAAIAATAPAKPAARPAKPSAEPAAAGDLSAASPKAEPVAPAKPVGKGFLQVGIFSVEQNAANTATSMKTNGLSARVVKETSQGKTFWRVIVGPAATAAEKDSLKAKGAKLGFADAYFVSG